MIQESTTIQNSDTNSEKKITKKKIKCHFCNKKLKLMEQIKCQCNQYFCPCHMNRHSHNCPLNNKQAQKDKIAKNNPVIKEKMIDKI